MENMDHCHSGSIHSHRQRVVINGRYSDWSYVSSGVIQESILGPLLFLYINELPSVVKSKIKIFTDDVILYRKVATHTQGLCIVTRRFKLCMCALENELEPTKVNFCTSLINDQSPPKYNIH